MYFCTVGAIDGCWTRNYMLTVLQSNLYRLIAQLNKDPPCDGLIMWRLLRWGIALLWGFPNIISITNFTTQFK